MAATPADLEARVRVLETRSESRDEDARAISDTTVETLGHVRSLSREVGSLREDVNGLKQDLAGLTWRVDGLQQDVSELKQDVGGLSRGMRAILAHLGLTVEPDNRDS